MDFSRKMVLLPADYESSTNISNQSEIINTMYKLFPNELIELLIKSKINIDLLDNFQLKTAIQKFKTPKIKFHTIKAKKYNKEKPKVKIVKRNINWDIASDSE
jgi:hypothetical protein